jgi:2,3-bisphosphoglycerate-dependent phosphoglycerate mutase
MAPLSSVAAWHNPSSYDRSSGASFVAVPAPVDYRQLRFVPPPNSTALLLVRHGESEALPVGSFPLVEGQGDPSLAPEGRREAVLVGKRLEREGVTAIYTSTLVRTQQTAAPLAEALGLVPTIERDLREVYLGDWEGGLYRKKIADGDPIALRMLAEESWAVIPGAEPADTFARRLRGVIHRIAGDHVGERIVVVAHAGVIGEILAQAAESRPFAFLGANNASISEILVTPDRWVIRSFNDSAHLVSSG